MPALASNPRRAYRGNVKPVLHLRRDRPQLVTEARRSRSEDITYRERRYLVMMGIRLVCFVIAVIVFVNGGGWLTAIPAAGAILIPYFAVVFANSGREPSAPRGFQAYQPNLPERFRPTDGSANGGPRPRPGTAEPPDAGTSGGAGVSER